MNGLSNITSGQAITLMEAHRPMLWRDQKSETVIILSAVGCVVFEAVKILPIVSMEFLKPVSTSTALLTALTTSGIFAAYAVLDDRKAMSEYNRKLWMLNHLGSGQFLSQDQFASLKVAASAECLKALSQYS